MSIISTTDSEGRVSLPGFANTRIIIETLGVDEIRIRRAETETTEDVRFEEEDMPIRLSERDALRFLELLDNPPAPNEAALKAARRFMEQYG